MSHVSIFIQQSIISIFVSFIFSDLCFICVFICFIILFFFIFFFSSRRRHTRSYGDWSSDVCSSDLCFASRPPICPESTYCCMNRSMRARRAGAKLGRVCAGRPVGATQSSASASSRVRSEERRVGKECRCRGWPDQGKKKEDRVWSEH